MYNVNYKHVKQLSFLNVLTVHLLICILCNYEKKVMDRAVLVKNAVFT